MLYQLVLQVGPGRADPARTHRISCLKTSGRTSTNFIRAGLNRAHVLKCRPSTALKHGGLASGRASPDPARKRGRGIARLAHWGWMSVAFWHAEGVAFWHAELQRACLFGHAEGVHSIAASLYRVYTYVARLALAAATAPEDSNAKQHAECTALLPP